MHHLNALIWCQVPIGVIEHDRRAERGKVMTDGFSNGDYHLQVVIVSAVSSVTPHPPPHYWMGR